MIFEKSWKLPEGWVWTSLGQVCELSPRLQSQGIGEDALVSFIPMSAVDDHYGAIRDSRTKPLRDVRHGYTAFREGDVLFAKITPCMENGKVAVARNLSNGLGFGSTEFHVIRPLGGMPPEWVYHYLRREAFRSEAAHHMTGTAGQKRVPREYMAQASFPLPPLPEQRRIVAKIETLRAKSRIAQQALASVPKLMIQLRLAVLAEAFRGRLTERDSTDEAAVSPLEWIQENRLVRNDSRSAREERRERELVQEPGDGLWTLPENWRWVPVAEVAEIVGGGTPRRNESRYYEKGTVPWAVPSELDPDRIMLITDTREHLTEAAIGKKSARLLPPGTVLFSSRASIGKIAIAGRPMVTNQGFANFVPRNIIDPWYLAYCLRLLTKEILRLASGTTYLEVAKSALKTFHIPLAPLAEQQRIVDRIEFLLSQMLSVDSAAQAAVERSHQIDQSVLNKAFRGQLVGHDPNDEPATVLLENIRSRDGAKRPPARQRTLVDA